MIRNDKEYRHTKEQLANLQANLDELSFFPAQRRSEETPAVMDAVGMKMEDIEREIAEYEDLKEGRPLSVEATSLDSLGELLVKARIARGLTQDQLAAELGMTQQQIARYERDGYQKISLWRLAEIAEALQVDLNVCARLPARQTIQVTNRYNPTNIDLDFTLKPRHTESDISVLIRPSSGAEIQRL